MKKIILLIVLSLFFVMCKSKKNTTSTAVPRYITYTSNFKGASAQKTNEFLKSINATEENTSALILTRNFIGAEIVISTSGKELYKGYAITDKSTGIAHKLAISNSADIRIYDTYNKQEVLLEAAEIKKHKFIYVARSGKKQPPFYVVYSTKLKGKK